MIRGQRVAISLALFVLTFIVGSSQAQAQYGQYQAPSPTQSILIEKMVAKPGTSSFVDNLSPSDPRFRPSQEVVFRLSVKNTSDVKLTNVTVRDFLPDFVDAVEGPGTFDSKDRSITFNAGDFIPNEEKVFTLKARTSAQSALPQDKGMICVVNKAQAFTSSVSDEDTAQFCIEKEVVGVTQVPSAGPEMGLALLALNTLGLTVGVYLRKQK